MFKRAESVFRCDHTGSQNTPKRSLGDAGLPQQLADSVADRAGQNGSVPNRVGNADGIFRRSLHGMAADKRQPRIGRSAVNGDIAILHSRSPPYIPKQVW